MTPEDFGINAKSAAAGLCGGLFSLFVMRELTTKQAIISILGGGVIATYCTELIVYTLHIPQSLSGGIGFALGVFGLAIIGKVLMFIESLTLDDLKSLSIEWVKSVSSQIIAVLKIWKGK